MLEGALISELIDWAEKNDIVLLADEVYQTNVYAEGKKFVSFKKGLLRRKRATHFDKSRFPLQRCATRRAKPNCSPFTLSRKSVSLFILFLLCEIEREKTKQ